MDAFFELEREKLDEIFVEFDKKRSFPSHFHSQIEIFILLEGSYKVCINGNTEILKPGTFCISDSYDVHSYESYNIETKNVLIIIPIYYLNDFLQFKGACALKEKFVYNPELCKKLKECACELIKTESRYLKNTYVNLLLGLISERCGLTSFKQEQKDIPLLQKILILIEKEFTFNLNLAEISKRLGYSKEHISRIFNKYLNESLPSYINQLRLKRVKTLMAEQPEIKISEAIFEAGFNSIQTYYRNLKKYG